MFCPTSMQSNTLLIFILWIKQQLKWSFVLLQIEVTLFRKTWGWIHTNSSENKYLNNKKVKMSDNNLKLNYNSGKASKKQHYWSKWANRKKSLPLVVLINLNSLYVWAPINTLRYEQQLLLIPQGTALLL